MSRAQGARVKAQALDSLLKWSETYIDDRALADGSASTYHPSPFPFDASINEKLVIVKGDVCSYPVDALVNPSNERLSDRSGATQRVYALAGPTFARESGRNTLDSLGSTVLVNGGQLPARNVIHTVGPRYQEKYITAAENALHKCYRNTMALAREQLFETIAYIPLHKKRSRDTLQYPRDSAAHTALRTIRRCLEKWGDTIKLVILASDNVDDHEAFKSVAPLYFPRNRAEEANALFLLPDNTGNANGELILKERMIRIEGSVPDPLLDEMESVEAELTTLRTRETAEQKRGDYEAAIATRDKVGQLTSRLHELRSQYNAKQALARAGSSTMYTAAMTSQKSREISRQLAQGGFANVRGDPDERDFGLKRDTSHNGKSLGRGYCGKLIKEGVLYKQGLRSKIWSRRSIQLTSEALVYSHAVRSHGGFIAVSSITACVGVDVDGEPVGFQIAEDNGARVHTYRCHSKAMRDEWLTAFETAKMVTKKDLSGARRAGAEDDDEDLDDDAVAEYASGALPARKGIILEGLLEKQGLRSRMWMKRHVSLSHDALTYSHGFFGSKKSARVPVGDMTRTTRLVDGIPTAEKDVQTVEFGILMKGGRRDLYRARTVEEANRWVNALNDLLAYERRRLAKQAVLDKRAAAKLAKPTAAPSELVVRQRTGGKYKAATVAQDPAAGVRLLSAERFNKNLFSFQCTDISNDCQWTVERTFKSIKQLYRTLVECKYISIEDVPKPTQSASSVQKLMKTLLAADCSMARVFLSEVDAQSKEADKAQWRVVAKRSSVIFRVVRFFDANDENGEAVHAYQGSARLLSQTLHRTTPGNAQEVQLPKSTLGSDLRVVIKAWLDVPFRCMKVCWDVSSTLSGVIQEGSQIFGRQQNTLSVDLHVRVPIQTSKNRVRLRFWVIDEAPDNKSQDAFFFDPIAFFGWIFHGEKSSVLERNATGKLRRKGRPQSSSSSDNDSDSADEED